MSVLVSNLVAHLPPALLLLGPELLLGLVLLLAMILELATSPAQRRFVVGFCLLGVALSGLLAIKQPFNPQLYQSSLVYTPSILSGYARLSILGTAAITLLASLFSTGWKGRAELGENAQMVVAIALGAMLLCSAQHLVALYLAVEFLSLASYPLAGFRAHDKGSAQAGVKYLLYGGVASAISLFGMSHLFGATGSLGYTEIGMALSNGPAAPGVLAALLLVSVGLLYKMSLVPFHFWSPDVYAGCPTLWGGFLSTAPKIAVLIALLQGLLTVLPQSGPPAGLLGLGGFFGLLSVTSILGGAVLALRQTDARRILAYSSISNAGVFLLPFASGIDTGSISALGIALLGYAAGNLGAFLALDSLSRSGSTQLTRLQGLGSSDRTPALLLTLSLISLAGIPPLAGFFGKWLLLRTTLWSGLQHSTVAPLSLLLAASTLVGALILIAAYLKVVRALWAESALPDAPPQAPLPWSLSLAPALAVAATLVFGLGWKIFDRFLGQLGG